MIPHLRYITRKGFGNWNLASMLYRRVRGDIIDAWKYLHGVYMTECPLMRNYDTRTRGNQLKLKKQYERLSLRRNIFTNRVADLWNHITNDIVRATNIHTLSASRPILVTIQIPSGNYFKGRNCRGKKKSRKSRKFFRDF